MYWDTMLFLLLVLFGLFAPIIHCHTISICSAVLPDQSVFIGAATYHTDSTVSGGAQLTVAGDHTSHDFTGWADDSNGRPPLRHYIECILSLDSGRDRIHNIVTAGSTEWSARAHPAVRVITA